MLTGHIDINDPRALKLFEAILDVMEAHVDGADERDIGLALVVLGCVIGGMAQASGDVVASLQLVISVATTIPHDA